jgi:hypothetical protein
MKAILDTLPPLPTAYVKRSDAPSLYTDDQLREDRRAIVEHVVRMCAEVAKSRALNWEGTEAFDCGALDVAATLLALLEPKP